MSSKVQWKSGSEDYDGSAGSTRQAEITDPASRTHTITGLTDGVEYTVRVIAVNDVGDGPPSDEATATPGETTPPELSTATVDGATLTLTYDEALDENSEPSSDAFSVTVGGTGRAVDGVSVSSSSVILTLGSAVTASDTVTVSYTVPADTADPRVRDFAGNATASFTGHAVTNNTPRPNSPATGAPTISGTVQVGETLTVETSAIDDADGLDNVSYTYQWLADDAEITGATSDTYTLVETDVGMGELTSEVFTLDGVDYTVKVLADSDGPQFYLTLDKALPVGFTLQVGATTLSSQDASIREFSSGATQYGWTNQEAILADVDTVEVSLTLAE